MVKVIEQQAHDLFGKECCRIDIGERKSLSLGFGKKIPNTNPKVKVEFYGEWELGTYYAAWRICQAEKVIVGSSDTEETIREVVNTLSISSWGTLKEIEQRTKFDVMLIFSNQVTVEFFGLLGDEDEVFHIFCPEHIYLDLAETGEWNVSQSNQPYKKD